MSGTNGVKKCRNASLHSRTKAVPVSIVFSFRYWTDRMLEGPAVKKIISKQKKF
jgi:hypothetical protein